MVVTIREVMLANLPSMAAAAIMVAIREATREATREAIREATREVIREETTLGATKVNTPSPLPLG
jgi:ATP-dependent 26S proteasome regulatory subunit